jgi:hypothetical protein
MSFTTDPRTICLAILLITTASLVIRARSRLARQRRQRTAEADQAGDYGRQLDFDAAHDETALILALSRRERGLSVPGDLAQWEVQMHETARRLSAQLDAKLSLLQTLIADAQRAAVRLEAALDHARPSLPPGSQAESLLPAVAFGREEPEHESTRKDLETAFAPIRPMAADDAPPSADRTSCREEIYHLADYGYASPEIARRVGSPVGEVELVLSLRAAG